MTTDILGPGAYGDVNTPDQSRKAYLETHSNVVPPFDDRAALFPLATPAAPTATAGDASASVSFSTVSGGVSYTATSTPGNRTGSASSSPITVNGLTNGTAYTFKLTATDVHGNTSIDSPASGSVTPAAAGG